MLPDSATAAAPLEGALGGEPALAGLLCYLAAAHATPPADPLHPQARLRRLALQLPPLMTVWAAPPSQARMGASPELLELLGRGRMDADNADLEVLARLLAVAVVGAAPRRAAVVGAAPSAGWLLRNCSRGCFAASVAAGNCVVLCRPPPPRRPSCRPSGQQCLEALRWRRTTPPNPGCGPCLPPARA